MTKMPLDRAHVTMGLRIMIPLITVFFLVVGLNYTFGGNRLVLSPSLAYADQIMPLSAWGLLFLFSGGMMATAMFTKSRGLYRYALLVCIVSMFIWTVIAMIAGIESTATRGGWAYPGFVLGSCAAVYRQLTSREVK